MMLKFHSHKCTISVWISSAKKHKEASVLWYKESSREFKMEEWQSFLNITYLLFKSTEDY